LYNQYINTFKQLTQNERVTLWNKYLEAKKEVEEKFKPFGFIC
jgi:diadenosine tetraphosphate (Ap4A) HIT family hydrolase